jgi:hypothetical protein
MRKADAIRYFGTLTAVAAAAGIRVQAVSQWGELVPEASAYRLALASQGRLAVDPELYRARKAARRAVA